MRLGIRRKLIGTLILVGLFPLAMSLIVVLGGGAWIQLDRIRGAHADAAADCSDRLSGILRDEVEKLTLLSRFPRVVAYVQQANKDHVTQTGDLTPQTAPAASQPAASQPSLTPAPTDADLRLDQLWPSLPASDDRVAQRLHNELADRLHLLADISGNPREILVTNLYGELIAANSKSDDFFQADEDWWQQCYDDGRGQLYLSTVVADPAHPDRKVVSIALPMYDRPAAPHKVIGIIKDKIPVSWLLRPMRDRAADLRAAAQLVDLDTQRTVYQTEAAPTNERARQFFFTHRSNGVVPISTLLFNNIIVGSAQVPLAKRLQLPSTMRMALPNWAVVVSKPSEEAMTPVYHTAITVAGVGIALVLVLFILGVAISNREVIQPILRLREATAAVGRGELNVRLLSGSVEEDPTFRKDELGDLARDFDEMTRQLQKNLNTLARSNEAKRRFMELAGHELRTPVTYLLGVCQLAQRQLQQLSEAATDGQPEDERSVALAAKNAAAVQGALAKISAKTQRLSRIIDNLLKLVNNDQFTTRMNKAPVDIRALLLQVTSDHRPFIAERKQQLVVEVAENLPSIEADRDKLEDALTNLISNAIRFSPDGGTVRVAAHEVAPAPETGGGAAGAGPMIEILVEDSGPGIPAADLANLFEPFYTGSDILHHHSGTFEFGSKGIGLGLAIVRRFVELHGGIVRAHPILRNGQTAGTQFQILLPVGKDPRLDSSGSTMGIAAIK
ncbi:MAG TPA: ATP-binding protein [Phycisphaerae bacterium]|nr:ATP-binding protein [Phycisphaerae bacterium]